MLLAVGSEVLPVHLPLDSAPPRLSCGKRQAGRVGRALDQKTRDVPFSPSLDNMSWVFLASIPPSVKREGQNRPGMTNPCTCTTCSNPPPTADITTPSQHSFPGSQDWASEGFSTRSAGLGHPKTGYYLSPHEGGGARRMSQLLSIHPVDSRHREK